MIKAKKGGQYTEFSEMAWNHMGKQKNGWERVSDEEYAANQPQPKEKGKATPRTEPTKAEATKPTGNVKADLTYKELTDKAKGFEKDGKLEEALAQYEAADKLNPNPNVKGKIKSLKKAIEEAGKAKLAEEFNSAVKDADKVFGDGDFATAYELYSSANGIVADDAYVLERLKACEAELNK